MRVGCGLGGPAQLSAQVERAVSGAAAAGAAARDGAHSAFAFVVALAGGVGTASHGDGRQHADLVDPRVVSDINALQ